MSWEHCYKWFCKARRVLKPDTDYLSLQLAFYLASWGMYRGSSFIVQKDYKIHEETVNIILDSDYDVLSGCEWTKSNTNDLGVMLENLIKKLKDYYGSVRKTVYDVEPQTDISDILISKILLGTLGCIPAYDSIFSDGLKNQGIKNRTICKRSLEELASEYSLIKEDAIYRSKIYGFTYPQMKIIDMGFWQIGYDLYLEEKNKYKIQ